MEDLQKWELFEMGEAAYRYFADIAQIMGPEFAPMIPKIVPFAIKSCISDEGINNEYRKSSKDDFALGSDDEEDAEIESARVNTSFINEKNAALNSLGIISIACPKDFLPHMESGVKILELLWNYISEEVRAQVVQTSQQFVESLNLAHYGTESHPKPVMGLPSTVKLSPDAHKFYYTVIFPRFMDQIKDDDNKEVVASILEAISDLSDCIGPAVVEERLPDLFNAVLLLLNRKAACQNEQDEDEDEKEDDEDIDHDELLTGNLMDLIQSLGKVCGEVIIPQMQSIFTSLSKYLNSNRSENDWAMGIGCFAELFRFLPSIIPQYGAKLLPLCFNYCSSDNNDLSRNAAYFIGMVAEKSKEIGEPFINEMLQALKNAYEIPKAQEPKDNAISSLLRMLVSYTNKLPLELILPAIFQNIPLNGDLAENVNIAKSLTMLSLDFYKANPKYLENALMTCVKTIIDSECDTEDEEKTLIGNYLKGIITIPEVEAVLKGIINKMSQTEVTQLQSFMT